MQKSPGDQTHHLISGHNAIAWFYDRYLTLYAHAKIFQNAFMTLYSQQHMSLVPPACHHLVFVCFAILVYLLWGGVLFVLRWVFYVYMCMCMWAWCKCMWSMHLCVQVYMHLCTQTRGGHQMASLTLHIIPLRKGLSLNLELGWQPASINIFLLPPPLHIVLR